MIPVFVLAVLICLITTGLIAGHLRAHRLSTCTWNDLILKLQPLELDDLRTGVAQNAASGSGELWDILGGMGGLRRMDNNAKIMIALAAYMERHNNHANMILAERMRTDGLIVRDAIRAIRVAKCFKSGSTAFQEHLQNATKSYAAMRRRLPALHEMSGGSIYGGAIEA